MIEYIKTSNLVPHLNNPRQDLGDLTELTASIKAQGVLQNLTVVPWEDHPDYYIVVIGHRRLAAAEKAGLEELPCVVSNMTEKQQIETMLVENIQRNDLTVYEQAQGFQMMLNLGGTVSDIAQHTGFSETTIRRRVNLLELDKDKFRESVERGATLSDFAELEKIKDNKLKNSVLDKIATRDFDWTLKAALTKEKVAENKAELIPFLDAFASKIKKNDYSLHEFVRTYYLEEDIEFERPDDADEVEYFYTDGGTWIYLYKDRPINTDNDDSEEDEKTREREERKSKLQALFNQAFDLRIEFAKSFNIGKKQEDAFNDLILASYGSNRAINTDAFRLFFGIEKQFRQSWQTDKTSESFDEAVARLQSEGVGVRTLLFAIAYSRIEAGRDATCSDWYGVYGSNEKLELVYKRLTALGYVMSTEEAALMAGTHELYVVQEDEPECKACKDAHPDCDECCFECSDRCEDGAAFCELEQEELS